MYERYNKNSFFQNYVKDNIKYTMYELFDCMEIIKVDPFNILFFDGDASNKFYMVISGEVAVMIPTKATKDNNCPFPEIY